MQNAAASVERLGERTSHKITNSLILDNILFPEPLDVKVEPPLSLRNNYWWNVLRHGK
jgi:hypothetical protein